MPAGHMSHGCDLGPCRPGCEKGQRPACPACLPQGPGRGGSGLPVGFGALCAGCGGARAERDPAPWGPGWGQSTVSLASRAFYCGSCVCSGPSAVDTFPAMRARPWPRPQRSVWDGAGLRAGGWLCPPRPAPASHPSRQRSELAGRGGARPGPQHTLHTRAPWTGSRVGRQPWPADAQRILPEAAASASVGSHRLLPASGAGGQCR